MSGAGPRLLDPAAFGAVFDTARRTVFRLEGRQSYAVASDDAWLTAFRTGAPRPVRSVRTDPWVARIAAQTLAGVAWSRVRVVTWPLTEYTRFEVPAFVESDAAGEEILILDTPAFDIPDDFWLIDAGTPSAVGVWMRYDDTGRILAREFVDDPETLSAMSTVAAGAAERAVPLNEWLALSRWSVGA